MCLPVSNGTVILLTVCAIQLILPGCRGKLLGSGLVKKFTIFFIVAPCILILQESLLSPTDALYICLGVY